jgi:hypothetical protein
MPRLDRNEAIIAEATITQATPIRASIKNKVLIAPPPVAGDAKKYQLRIDVWYSAS